MPEENHSQTRRATFCGSPKKKAALLGSSKYSGGRSVGLVPTYHTPSTAASSTSCQTRMRLMPLARIALENLLLHRVPDERMQLDEARRQPHFGHVARTRQV